MSAILAMHSRLIETLYCEALVLYDEVIASFSPNDLQYDQWHDEVLVIATISTEKRRAIGRLKSAIAWLLHQRRLSKGNTQAITQQSQLAPLLPKDIAIANPQDIALLSQQTAQLVATTCRFYERVLFLGREPIN